MTGNGRRQLASYVKEGVVGGQEMEGGNFVTGNLYGRILGHNNYTNNISCLHYSLLTLVKTNTVT